MGSDTTGLRERLQTALGATYAIERELGGGGMSRVFVAEEAALGRQVVIKVLPPEMSGAVSAERFRREIHLAARLHHPHIVPVLHAGEAGELLYYTMPLVDGETLRARLAREGELPIDDAVRILRDVADALCYAHEHGVIHRDLKPENVLLSGRHALVTDFGVAKALSAAADAESTLTSAGVALGTPAYMAPEQAAADPQADHRADLYALGVIAYETLTGSHPFPGRPAQAVLAAHAMERPEPITRRRSTIPPALGALVMRLLEKRPADRPQSADEALHALEAVTALDTFAPSGAVVAAAGAALRPMARPSGVRGAGTRWRVLVTAAVAVLLAAGAFVAWRLAPRSAGDADLATPGGTKTLAVLPFENLGDSSDRYFADGVTDAIRGKLAALPELEVTASYSSNQYRHTTKSPREIARELGVTYLLVGRVRWAKRAADGRADGSTVQVSPELIQASTGTTRWGEPFEANVTDVFQVQSDIATRVADALDVALGTRSRQVLASQPTESFDAYTHYLRGRQLASEEDTPAALRRAAAEFQSAVELDSTFADAWAALAAVHSELFRNGGVQAADTRIAAHALARAEALAPTAAETRIAASQYALLVRGDAQAALQELRAALDAAPGRSDLLARTARLELALQHTDAAISDLTRAVRLDPRSAEAFDLLAASYLELRRLPEARAAIARARALRPSSLRFVYTQARIAAAQGDLDGVRHIFRDAQQTLGPRPIVAYMALREDIIFALDSAQLRQMLELSPADLDGDRADWALALAEGHALIGNHAAARAYGDTAAAAYAELQRSMGSRGPSPDVSQIIVALRGLALAYAGRTTAALAEVQRAVAMDPDVGYVLYLAARAELVAGSREQAMTHLEQLVRLRHGAYTGDWLRIDGRLAPLRNDPRFTALVRRGMGSPGGATHD